VNVNFYLKGKKPKEKPIVASYRREGILVNVGVGIIVGVKNWNTKTQRVRNTIDEPHRDSINEKLDNIQKDFKELYLKYCFQHPNKEKIKKYLHEAIKGKPIEQEMTLFKFFEVHISELRKKTNPETGKPLSPETINKFMILKDDLLKFRDNLTFDGITQQFYYDYTHWLRTERQLSTNTIGKYIRALKEVLNNATSSGYNTNMEYKSKNFKIPKVKNKEIYLNEDELERIYDLNLSDNKALDNARNLFLIGCYSGAGFSDFTKVLNEALANPNVREVTYTREKNNQQATTPILERTRELIIREPHIISNQKLNVYIKEIGQLAGITDEIEITKTIGNKTETIKHPKYRLIKTHTARRSFATNSIKKGIPVKVIMSATGHKKESSLYDYIRTTAIEDMEIIRNAWGNNVSE